jgi:hypothetical protein
MLDDIGGGIAKLFADGTLQPSWVVVICLGWACFKLFSALVQQTATSNDLQTQAALALQSLVEQVKAINASLTEVRQQVAENAETAKRVELRQQERSH